MRFGLMILYYIYPELPKLYCLVYCKKLFFHYYKFHLVNSFPNIPYCNKILFQSKISYLIQYLNNFKQFEVLSMDYQNADDRKIIMMYLIFLFMEW